MLRRNQKTKRKRPIDDRAWSAPPRAEPAPPGTGLGRHAPLPAETGPTWAPDQLSVWPVEGGRYGIDAHYHGATGAQRAEHQLNRVAQVGLTATVRIDGRDRATLRLGPLTHQAAWIALEAFLGRPLDLDP